MTQSALKLASREPWCLQICNCGCHRASSRSRKNNEGGLAVPSARESFLSTQTSPLGYKLMWKFVPLFCFLQLPGNLFGDVCYWFIFSLVYSSDRASCGSSGCQKLKSKDSKQLICIPAVQMYFAVPNEWVGNGHTGSDLGNWRENPGFQSECDVLKWISTPQVQPL